ncbi:MAG: efflux RND transporter permease subunit [Kordiimonadaceae bacterium]|jgi:multidrug efflux pump|nr:efflux RND transporter permease subunit [Kordiimonadaceae bacterium]MBT6036679.1 efflux RND transporter permease subunit [Kordiimonadaceae bacterium]
MNAIINAAIDHYRVVLLCLVLIFGGGTAAYITTPKEAEPDITIPTIYINLIHDGISPEDSARLLVKPLETTLRTIEGVKMIRGIGREGGASVIIEFNAGIEPDLAVLDVREQVDKARSELPVDTKEPTIREINFGEFPILNVVLFGSAPDRVIYKIARRLRDDLESVPAILKAVISGDRDDLLEIVIDPLKLEMYDLSYADLYTVINNNNRLIAAGSLDNGNGRFSVKIPGIFETAEDVYNIPLKVSGNGIVTLQDVATIRKAYKDPTSYARFNDQPAVSLGVSKRTGENIILTDQIIREIVRRSAEQWPEGINYDFVGEKSKQVLDSVSSLQNSIISAILLVSIAMIVALGERTALLVAISIPGSFLLSIFLMNMLGMSINQVTMFGLILSVGLLVDGAIVVTEYADRKMQEGLDKKVAYRMAAQRMAWPILASTATTLAAFLPLLFWPGLPGEFMSYLPLTLIFTLSSSFLMALIFMPTLGSIIGKKADDASDNVSHLAAGNFDVKDLKGMTGSYVRLVDKIIRHPIRFSSTIIGGIVAIFIAYGMSDTPVQFFPEMDPEGIQIHVHARGNLSLNERDHLVRQVSDIIKINPYIKNFQSTTTAVVDNSQDRAEDVVGTLFLNFVDWNERPTVNDIITDLRQQTANIPGMVVEYVKPASGPVQGKHIQLELTGENLDVLIPAVNSIYQYMENEVEGITDLENTLPLPGIQWELEVDRALAGFFGTDITNVGSVIQLVTNGIKVGEYRPDDADDEVDIRVRFPEEYRNITQLDEVRVQTRDGLVPIGNFVKRVAKQKISTVERIDTKTAYKIRANVVQISQQNNISDTIREWIAEQNFDSSVTVKFAGMDEEQQESQAFLAKAFLMALFLMALILVTQFNSFYHSGLILLAVLLSTAGVLLGIMITGRTFQTLMTGVGIISLAGIVVNNNIVLIDTYARLKESGMEAYEAIVQTVAQRLRPVMLTTITTVVGLLPMIFMVNIDFANRNVEVGAPYGAFWVDLAIALSFGLLFATVLTLLLTPCMLAARIRLSKKYRESNLRPLSGATPQIAE